MTDISLREKQNKAALLCSSVLFGASLLMLMILLSKITLYSDDFYFGTFFDFGPQYFFDNTLDHYLTANGRMLIHFLLELTLLGDTWIYLILCPAVLCLCAWLLNGAVTDSRDLVGFFTVVAVSVLLLLGLKVDFLNSSLLWMSGSFNFILPVVFVFGAVFFYRSDMEKGRLSVSSAIFAFCAGATTEQFGFYACIALWGMWIMALKRKEQCFSQMWFVPILCLIGYLTVLTAPGMWGRVDNETEGFWSFLDKEVLYDRFCGISYYFFGLEGCGTLLVFFCLVSASLVFASRSYPRLLLLGYPAALILFYFDGRDIFWGGIVFFIWLLFLGIVMVSRKEHTVIGCILLGSVGTQLLLIITAVYGYRTAMPLIVTLIFLTALFLREIFRGRSLWLWLPVIVFIAAFSFYHYIPTYQGYASARVVIDRNLESLAQGKETGKVNLNLDVDTTYGYTPFYENSYFYLSFKTYYGYRDDPAPIYLEGDDYPPLYINGEQALVPCVVDAQGNAYVSLTSLIGSLDGTNENEDGLFHISICGREAWLWSDGTNYKMYADPACEHLLADHDDLITSICSFTFLKADALKTVFDLEVIYNAEKEIYEIYTENKK